MDEIDWKEKLHGEVRDRYYQNSNYPDLVVDYVIKEAYARGRKDENKRLEKEAREYNKKGFELEMFIYSGFLPKLEDIEDLAAQEEETLSSEG